MFYLLLIFFNNFLWWHSSVTCDGHFSNRILLKAKPICIWPEFCNYDYIRLGWWYFIKYVLLWCKWRTCMYLELSCTFQVVYTFIFLTYINKRLLIVGTLLPIVRFSAKSSDLRLRFGLWDFIKSSRLFGPYWRHKWGFSLNKASYF